MTIDKSALRETMLTLEGRVIAAGEQAYQRYLAEVRVDRDQPWELDDLAQAGIPRELAQETQAQLAEHRAHMEQVRGLDFTPAARIRPGAVVRLEGSERYLVVGIATDAFTCQGRQFMGISPESPLYRSLEGLEAGDAFDFGGRELRVREVG